MKEKWIKIRTVVLIIALVVVGVLEYIQLMDSFDLPQVMLVMPIVGAVSFITLKKYSFAVPVCTILFACAYQIVAGDANAMTYLQTDAGSIARVLMYVLPVCMLFELLGMGGGALIRVLINRKKKPAIGVLCMVLGLFIVFGPYEVIFKNPLYPIQARIRLERFADEAYTDYKIGEKNVYFNLNTSSYQCRVSMVDGVIRLIYFDENGNVTDKQ